MSTDYRLRNILTVSNGAGGSRASLAVTKFPAQQNREASQQRH